MISQPLQQPGSNANTSSFAQRVTAEQAAIESRLIELQGVETINTGLRKTHLIGDDDMAIDFPPDPPTNRILEAKRKALAQFVSISLPCRRFFPFLIAFRPDPLLQGLQLRWVWRK